MGQGLDALDDGKWRDAKILFSKALEEDPEFDLARYYYEHCPAATVATISSLSAMSAEQLAQNVEESMDEAIGEQISESINNDIGAAVATGQAAAAPPAGNTGSVSISW